MTNKIQKEDEEYTNYLKHSKSKGQRKLRAYFKEIIRKKIFTEEVKRIREKYNVPINGYSMHDEEGMENYPERNLKTKSLKKFHKDIKKLSDEYGLYSHYWIKVISEYIWNNSESGLKRDFMNLDKCYLEDFYGLELILHNIFKPEKQPIYKVTNRDRKSLIKMYPVVIRISPYASIQEIVNYINMYSKEIKTAQKKHLNEKFTRIIEVRPKSEKKMKIKDLIYKNQDKPIKKIAKMINLKFNENLDHGHIGKLLSNERKNRR